MQSINEKFVSGRNQPYLLGFLYRNFYRLVGIITDYISTESPISHKYLNHGALIELI
ncbi:hypothetical protein B0T26DRAFT_786691 [Lasiosphaeria miniovina]|uniref:Uncharacterized protein n=1 Tax=Lasiosphaeria miniovina TaxID=1954250 RepID=A0AA40A637_9PEZI|nr:uncharacterized protein B0T26DRAFT_786691 [Lasiosphaeria miniovina]KAK0709861.1 hypothetical protein B0T26DRAFT_786691 [Lasiosphaeria miniovina]